MVRNRSLPVLLLLAAALPSLAGCDPVTLAAAGAGTIGTAAMEERGLSGADDDPKIRAQINERWFQHDTEMFRKVGLTVHEGRVLLTGDVKQPDQRVDAVRLAWQAEGVREVINEIQVSDQSGLMDYAHDVWLANKLRGELLFDRGVRNVNYSVDAVNGTIYLMGIAQDVDERDRVVSHARDISGVKKVINYVILKDDPRRGS